MSLIHPGASINFDGTDLQRSEEEEIQQEDIKQQRELQELLSAELPEDLLNDSCNGSLNSHQNENQLQSCSNSQSSSNTGSWRSTSNDDPNHHQSNVTSSGDASAFFPSQIPTARRNFMNGYGKEYLINEYGQPYTDAEKWQMQQQYSHSNPTPQIPTRDNENYYFQPGHLNYMNQAPEVYGFAERREAEGSEDFDKAYQREHKSPAIVYPQFSSPAGQSSNAPGKNVRFEAFSAPTSPYNQHYPIQHKRPNRYAPRNSEEMLQSPKSNSMNKADDSVGSDYVDASDRNIAEESGDSREIVQLRILYDARGKRIDKLSREIEALKQDSDREKRILSHQLAMAEDQKLGMSGSLEECQQLLVRKDRKINEGEGKVNALQIEVDSLKNAKLELVKKIEVGERTIENLQQELGLMQRSDALERVRQQHDDVIRTMTEQHEVELLEVSTMLDEVRRAADEKTEEVEQLRNRLKSALKESEDVLFEKSETINRLSRNLEDAQNHCQSLLAGSGESAFLQHQVKDLKKEKASLEEKNKTLEETVADLQKNLSLYENAFRLGATPRPLTPGPLSDSYNELMGGKRTQDWKSPKLGGNKSPPEDLVESLRQELERALNNNKEKRDKVSELQKQVAELTEESRHWRNRVDEVAREKQNDSGRSSNPHQNDLERELEDSLQRTHSAEERAMRLEETCRDLKQQMCEIIEQHDANKQEAVDRCERACMLLHEDAKRAIREELLAEHEQKVYELSVDHDGVVQNLKNELDTINHELSEVKQSYVHICSDKDSMEQKIKMELEAEKQELLKKVEKDKKETKAAFEKEWEQTKKQEEEEWEKRSEELVSAKITLAKVTWMEEHAKLREDALRDLTKNKDDEFSKRCENLRNQLKSENEREITRILEEEKTKWENEKDKEVESRINKLYEELNEEKKTAVSAATSIAQLNWITEQRNSNEVEFERRLSEAERVWTEKHTKMIEEKTDEMRKKMQNKIEVLNEERDNLVNQEVRRAEREWRRKRDESLRRKDDEIRQQLRKMQEDHQKEYEEFTNHHKKTLEKFLQGERSKTSIKEKQNDVMDELQKQWSSEREHLLHGHKSELKRLQAVHEARCQDYRSEIQRLSASYDAVMQRLSSQDGDKESIRIVELQKLNKEEMDLLKNRMKDEYRRWKRERDELRLKLEEAKSKESSADAQIDPKMFVDLREIYINTLGTVKGEMLEFIREGRSRSEVALKREAGKERERIMEKLRNRPRHSENLIPQYLSNQQSTSCNRPPSLQVHGKSLPIASSSASRIRNFSPSVKESSMKRC